MLGTPGSGALRVARGLVCALVGLVLGTYSHVLAEGHPPGVAAMVLAFAVLGLVGVALAECRRGFAFIATVLGGGQLFLHLVFSASSAPSIVVQPGTGHHTTATAAVASGHGTHAAADAVGAWSTAMAFGHIAVTLVAALCLAYGERAMWRVAGLVIPVLSWGHPRPVPVGVFAVSARPEPVRQPLIEVLLARCVPRRGPPECAPV